MPVDYTGLLIGLAVWIGGTALVFSQIRPRPGDEGSFVDAIGWTVLASVFLFAAGVFVFWFYDFLTTGA